MLQVTVDGERDVPRIYSLENVCLSTARAKKKFNHELVARQDSVLAFCDQHSVAQGKRFERGPFFTPVLQDLGCVKEANGCEGL